MLCVEAESRTAAPATLREKRELKNDDDDEFFCLCILLFLFIACRNNWFAAEFFLHCIFVFIFLTYRTATEAL